MAQHSTTRAAYRFRWLADPEPDDSWMEPTEQQQEHVWEVCLLETKCPTCGSWHTAQALGGIVDADEAYARTIEADLCAEEGIAPTDVEPR